MNSSSGQLFWVTGLAGAGKTTIGKELYSLVNAHKTNVVFLDGDTLREVFGNNFNYSQEERLKLALQYSRLCKMLTEQGLDVVCATISMFKAVRDWNRKNIPHYREIYIRVPLNVLIERDQKQLYSRALKGEVKEVMGIDLPIEEPLNPDLIIENGGIQNPRDLAKKIFSKYFF